MYQDILNHIKEADYVLVGVGEEFQVNFLDMPKNPKYSHIMSKVAQQEKYDWVQSYLIHDYIRQNNFEELQNAYENLSEILREKDYFVVSTCVDDLIRNSSIDQKRLVTPCGSFYNMQCEKNCGVDVEYGEPVALDVTREIFKNPNELGNVMRPTCEKCGAHFVFNTVYEENYDEKGYQEDWKNYSEWLQKTVNCKLVLLELGALMTYPSVIRWAFEKTSYFNKKSTFYRVNTSIYQLSEQTENRGKGIKMNPIQFLKECVAEN